MTGFRKISRNVDFWPKMAIFLPKRAKTAKTGFFGRNPKMSLPSHWEAPTLCKKSEQSYERISRSPPDARTNGRTNGRTNERDLIGPNAPRGTKNHEI